MLKVLTPGGWSNFKGIKESKEEVASLTLENGLVLECTFGHLVESDKGFIPFSEVCIGDSVSSKDGYSKVEQKSDSKGTEYVYDLLGVENDSKYYTNGIVSHNCIFRGSQNSLLPGSVLEQMVVKDPIETHDDLKIFYQPIENHMYVMCVDVSEGVGGDYHAVTVIDISTNPYEVVAVFHNNRMSPLLLPNLLMNVAMKYNDAMVIIESESSGSQVASDLYYDMEYENTLMTVSENGKQAIGFGGNGRIGVKMSKQVKGIGCSTIKTLVEKGKINTNYEGIVDEFGTFVPKGGSYAAEQGSHDDLVMTLVLFGWLSTQAYFIDLTNVDLRKNLFEGLEERAMEEVMPFGFIDSGPGMVTHEVMDIDSYNSF